MEQAGGERGDLFGRRGTGLRVLEGAAGGEAAEQPRLGRRELDPGLLDDPPIDLGAHAAARDRADDPLELSVGAVLARRGEALADPLRRGGRAERHLAQEPGEQERGDREPGSGEEDRRERRRERLDVRLPDRRREVLHDRRVRRGRNVDAGGSRSASSVASRLAKIAPKIETPIEPPIWRNSVEPEVATPSILYGTAFWAASTSTCITIPRPRPSTSM